MKKTVYLIYLSFLFFLGISAIMGGVALIVSPSGSLLGGLPLSILKHSPFSDFFVPGIILLFALGVFPIFTVWALIKKPVLPFAENLNIFRDMHWSWSYSIYSALTLIIWILIETYYIQGVGWLQMFYMLYSIPMLLVTLLPTIRKRYQLLT